MLYYQRLKKYLKNATILYILLAGYCHSIEHTMAKKHCYHITSCKMKFYNSFNFNTFVHVTILTPICSNLSHLFALIRTPIITIQ